MVLIEYNAGGRGARAHDGPLMSSRPPFLRHLGLPAFAKAGRLYIPVDYVESVDKKQRFFCAIHLDT